jgi:hypothetical protein
MGAESSARVENLCFMAKGASGMESMKWGEPVVEQKGASI